jgi:DNA-binding XRE family transcriptional regulator
MIPGARDFDVERPRLVGIYFLMRAGEVFYLGQSIDIEQRIRQHRSDPRMREVDRVLWIDVATAELDMHEGALLRALRPVGNTRRAPGEPANDQAVLARFGIAPREAVKPSTERIRRFVALGLSIKALRKAAGLKQQDVASRLGVTKSAVSHWEAGWSQPERSLVAPLASALGVDVAQLMVTL